MHDHRNRERIAAALLILAAIHQARGIVCAAAGQAILLSLAAASKAITDNHGSTLPPKPCNPKPWAHFHDKPPHRFKRLFGLTKLHFAEVVERIDHAKLGPPGTRGPKPLITTSHKLGMTLRYFRGGSPLDIVEIFNVSDAAFYRSIHSTRKALFDVLDPMPLQNILHDTAALASLAAGFAKRSYGWLNGAIGAIDGLLVPILRDVDEEVLDLETALCRAAARPDH